MRKMLFAFAFSALSSVAFAQSTETTQTEQPSLAKLSWNYAKAFAAVANYCGVSSLEDVSDFGVRHIVAIEQAIKDLDNNIGLRDVKKKYLQNAQPIEADFADAYLWTGPGTSSNCVDAQDAFFSSALELNLAARIGNVAGSGVEWSKSVIDTVVSEFNKSFQPVNKPDSLRDEAVSEARHGGIVE